MPDGEGAAAINVSAPGAGNVGPVLPLTLRVIATFSLLFSV
jgi:hypothetical protein